MLAVRIKEPGGVDVLEVVDAPRPEIRPDQILVRNYATALNRADVLRRRGLCPPAPGESEILGYEFAGEVAEVGERVRGFRRGDRVFGIVGGGAYAEFVAADPALTMPISDRLSYEAAASIPESFATANESLFQAASLETREVVLVHAGASGVGTAAIQLARRKGAKVLATVGSEAKAARCRELGAAVVVWDREEDFAEFALAETDGRGVDVILDLIGASYWDRNLESIAPGGRWVLVGLLGGARVAVELGRVLAKRLRIFGVFLRYLPLEEKAAVIERLRRDVLPLIERGDVRPVVDSVRPIEEVREAHARMEASLNVGKIVLRL
ncbi:MAG: NAD(P)H-quinone oxidoreductase [Planctomycetota bacterium]